MADDSLLISLKIDGDGTGSIVEKTVEAVKELIRAKKELTASNEEEAKQLALNEKAIEQQNDAIKKTKQVIDAEEGSIAKLRESNKKLTAERNATSTATEAGRKKIAELNQQLDANNKTIKENVDAYTKQKIGVGGYREALEGLVPGLKGVTGGIDATTKSSLAFIATPIGAVIAALGIALTAIISYFKGSEEGADKFARVSAQVSAIIGVLTDRLIAVGGALVSFLSGDWSAGLDKMKSAFSGVGDEISREIKLAGELADALDALEEAQLSNSIAISVTTNEIKKLLVEAKNVNLTEQQRIDLYDKALKLEKEQLAQTEAVKMRQLELTAKQLQADFSQFESAQRNGETTLDFVNRLIGDEGILFDRRKELADQLIEYNNILGESLTFQEKIAAKRAKDVSDQIELDKKLNAQKLQNQKDIDAMNAAEDKQRFTQIKKTSDQELTSANEKVQLAKDTSSQIVGVHQLTNEQVAQLRQQDLEDDIRAFAEKAQVVANYASTAAGFLNMGFQAAQAQRNAELSKVQATEKQKLNALELRFKQGAITEDQYNKDKDRIQSEAQARELVIKKKSFEAEKKNKINQTVATTVQSAVSAFNSFASIPIVGTVLGIAAAGAALLFGYKQVDAIRKTEFTGFAGGGAVTGTRINSSHGLRTQRANGDNLLATVRTGEVILNEQQQARLGGDRTFRAIGVPGFASGGSTGLSNSVITTRNFEGADLARKLDQLIVASQNQRPVLVLQDFQVAAEAKNTVEVKASN
jgi:hypothetical protein